MESHAEVEIGARPQLLDYSLHNIQHGGAGPEQVHVRDTQWQQPQPTMRGSGRRTDGGRLEKKTGGRRRTAGEEDRGRRRAEAAKRAYIEGSHPSL
uniref:Uncharacterized protein n=1 Tax=Aegilops tauschii TaxID=37682 RepID=M8AYQ9_AEGTA